LNGKVAVPVLKTEISTLSTVLCIFKKQRFGDWILSPSSGKTYSVKDKTMDNVQKHSTCVVLSSFYNIGRWTKSKKPTNSDYFLPPCES
jgi:hypothetical protein